MLRASDIYNFEMRAIFACHVQFIVGNATWIVTVSVMVVDQYGLTDTAVVQVTITDINNNVPTFSQSVYSADLYGEHFSIK